MFLPRHQSSMHECQRTVAWTARGELSRFCPSPRWRRPGTMGDTTNRQLSPPPAPSNRADPPPRELLQLCPCVNRRGLHLVVLAQIVLLAASPAAPTDFHGFSAGGALDAQLLLVFLLIIVVLVRRSIIPALLRRTFTSPLPAAAPIFKVLVIILLIVLAVVIVLRVLDRLCASCRNST